MASSNPKGADGFPVKAALAIVSGLAVLTAARFYKDHTKGIDPGVFRRVVEFHWPHRPEPALKKVAPAVAAVGRAPGLPAPISAYLEDDQLALDPFFAALWELEKKVGKPVVAGAPTQVVTILHYGDSPTTADLITGDARAQLQQRFGDAGFGFNLAAKPWAWYGHRNVEMSDGDWASSQKDATGVGRYKQGSYGLGGAVFAGSAGAHTTYTLKGEPQSEVRVHYWAGPGQGSLAVQAGDGPSTTWSAAAEQAEVGVKDVVLPAETKKVSLRVSEGAVKAFGVDFRTGKSGVLYDSLGLNGATTTVLSRTFDPALMAESFKFAQPQLVIINYGTNESQFDGLIKTLDAELRTAIARVRAADPGVPILIMSPMDRGQRQGGDIQTMATIPKIVAIQKHVAETTGCAFFDTYDAMGGEGTVGRWYGEQPRLMTADLIHPTPQGAVLVANLLVDNLYLGYDRWKRGHGVGLGAPVVRPVKVENARVGKPAAMKVEQKAEKKVAAAKKEKVEEKPKVEEPEVDEKPDGSDGAKEKEQ